jgi:hypothetical protein
MNKMCKYDSFALLHTHNILLIAMVGFAMAWTLNKCESYWSVKEITMVKRICMHVPTCKWVSKVQMNNSLFKSLKQLAGVPCVKCVTTFFEGNMFDPKLLEFIEPNKIVLHYCPIKKLSIYHIIRLILNILIIWWNTKYSLNYSIK